MKIIQLQNIKILFECETHQTKHTCDPIDLITCGTPLCLECNEEMSIASDYIQIKESDMEKV